MTKEESAIRRHFLFITSRRLFFVTHRQTLFVNRRLDRRVQRKAQTTSHAGDATTAMGSPVKPANDKSVIGHQ